MEKTIYKKFSDIESQLKGSKHVKLQDIHGKDIVAFNQPKKPIAPKIAAIKAKLQNLPNGLYCVVAQDRFGANVHQDKYYFGKGKYEAGMSEPREQFTPAPVSNNSDNVLSMDKALENFKEVSKLEARNTILENENADLKAKLAAALSERDALKAANEELSEAEDESSPWTALSESLTPILPMIPGIADRYFNLKEKQEETKRAQIMLQNGHQLPRRANKVNGHNKQQRAQMPTPGTPQWEQYVNEVMELDDDKFTEHMALIEEKFPQLYPHLEAAVMEEDEEGGEE